MYWKLALAQHPMYLLIKEDTMCAERTPPWGAPDIESYIVRLRQNIDTLRKYPQIKIGYEWSGLELEQLAQDAPEVFRDIMDLVNRGQSTFYNGTYSQPHLQTLSSEANYRQFEWGARVYQKLCNNYQVLAYAHQESSLNEQTPQLLKAFGIRYGVLPHFSCTMNMLDGGEILFHSRFGTMFMNGEEFASWRGLDGTETDLYLEEPCHMRVKEWISFQEMLGKCHVPPVMVEIPDLIEVDEDWINERKQADFALLDEALAVRLAAFPPRFHVKLYTNWSYIEGIRAEELSRNNYKAETAALRAESLGSIAYALLGRPASSTDAVWKKILTTQHHDVYCFCAPELREKSVCWLQEAEAEAAALADQAAMAVVDQVNTKAVEGEPLVVFNCLPHPVQSVVTALVNTRSPVISAADGSTLAADVVALADGKTQVRFLADLNGLGYSTFAVRGASSENAEAVEQPLGTDFAFENRFYRVTVQPDGTFTSLVILPCGEELLQGAVNPGNLLQASDSTGLGSRHEGTFNITKGERWSPSERGPKLHWQAGGPATVRRSALGAVLTVPGTMGASVNAVLIVNFYHGTGRIDIDWTFKFDNASVGHFFDDETKLCVQWPLSFKGEINHDIAFGVVSSRDERPFLPASWVDISDGKKGLAYFHTGTIKHWFSGQTLFNLFAWGEDTDAIGNRLDLMRWPKCFDQRLRGTHVIRTAIFPHSGSWREADIIGAARGYETPTVAYSTTSHPGQLPAEMELLRLNNPEMVATSVNVEGGNILCRLYSVAGEIVPVDAHAPALRQVQLTSLAGEPLNAVAPFQIAHAIYTVEK